MKKFIIIGLFALLLFGCINPQQPQTQNVSENTTINKAKVMDIVNLIKSFVELQGGDPNSIVFNRAYEKDGFIVIVVSANGREQELYATKDLEFVMFQPPMKVSELKAQLEQLRQTMKQQEKESKNFPKTEKPKVELYIMSFCPFGNQAEQLMKPVVELLGNTIDFEPVYIVSGEQGNWHSLHGDAELRQDVREKIIYNLYGPKTWVEYVYKVDNECSMDNIDDCWKTVAEDMGLNISAIEEQYNQSFDEILQNEAEKVSANGVTGSPTLIINGKRYNDSVLGRSSKGYKDAICSAFTTQPNECNESIENVNVNSQGQC